MASGRLHRYGETGAAPSEASLLEAEFARETGRRYCVAMNSCGSTMFVALKALGVRQGDAGADQLLHARAGAGRDRACRRRSRCWWT